MGTAAVDLVQHANDDGLIHLSIPHASYSRDVFWQIVVIMMVWVATSYAMTPVYQLLFSGSILLWHSYDMCTCTPAGRINSNCARSYAIQPT